MAPLKKRQKKALAAAPPAPALDAADCISRLPEEVQAHILSFLPAQEAVRTCVLARTWRHVWRFTRRLLITGTSVEEVRKLVHRLLRVRLSGLKRASLGASEIRFVPLAVVEDDDDDGGRAYLKWKDMGSIKSWIRQVLKCQIETLRVDIPGRTDLDVYLKMTTTLLVSPHLTRLELTGILFTDSCLNLDGCPALEQLEINECCFEDVRNITSLSVKRLVITSCNTNFRIQICVPRLVSLWLDNDEEFRTPLLARMPELVEAKVHICSYLDDCQCKDLMNCYHVMTSGDTLDSDFDSDDEEGSGDYDGENTTKCVVLEGLAEAKDLVLTAGLKMYILRRDLKWCPIFSKLKTLVLNDYWCQPADCSALACILEHAPLLEKLTLVSLQWLRSRGKYKVEMKGHPDGTVKSTKILQHLEVVEIKCEAVNERFLNVLNFLGTLNIDFDIRVTNK